jgi:23S rRNA (guanosine2251-2'-O)-methyltransferase
VAVLAGIHPVREALRAGRPIDRILIAKGTTGPKIQEIIDLAKERQIQLRQDDRGTLDRAAGKVPHQGVVAFHSSLTSQYANFNDLIRGKGLIVLLDGVEDPHNLGAVVRTAHAAGAAGIVIPERRAVGITETVAKASAGALVHLPIARVVNIGRAIEDLKEAGYWIYGLDERGEHLYDQVDITSPVAIVMGGEGHGVHDIVKKKCDFLVRIPMAGAIASLNVSVATGVMLFEFRRRMGHQ